MKKIQESGIFKFISALLLVSAVFCGAAFALWIAAAIPYVQAESFRDTGMYYRLMQQDQEDLAAWFAYRQMLQQDGLSYVERQNLESTVQQVRERIGQPGESNFYFQVKTSDGQQVLLSNVKQGETLESSVDRLRYSSFYPGEFYVMDESGSYEAPSMEPTASIAPALLEEKQPLIIEYGVARDVKGGVEDEYTKLLNRYDGEKSAFTGMLVLLGVCILLAGIGVLALMWAAGHKAGEEGIAFSWQEKIFFDVYLLVAGFAGLLVLLCMGEFANWWSYQAWQNPAREEYLLMGGGFCAMTALLAGICTMTLYTLAVRLKARALARSTLLCRVLMWSWRLVRDFIRSLPITWKVVGAFVCYFFVGIMLFTDAAQGSGISGAAWFLLNGAVLFLLSWWCVSFHRISKGGKAIAAGDLRHQIDTHRMPQDLRAHAEDLNNLTAGLQNAVDEQMKSERFKAELITNVSHDLKTPLTSIISYVDLLKTTRQEDPKAVEYIDVLDRKAQRLKKLTEDLVEASKASTGTLKVNREKIGMSQLIDQALGEYEEKLQSRNLTLVTTLPEEETYVYADGRHVWRVIDNLLGNCCKYAMENTRVYLELTRGKGQVVLAVKNISREPLNIPPERLMERFVRGEESRTTEGSGLGLSIARSLTELQGGTFELAVDGDLFKAIVTLPQAF